MPRNITFPTHSIAALSRKIAEVVMKLKPQQSLEFDPKTGVVSISTELVVPGDDQAQIAEILARRGDHERVSIRRDEAHYRISLLRHLHLQR